MSHLVDLLRVEGAWPWFVREVEITGWVAARGTGAPRPIAGPFRDEDVSISLWEWLDHDPYPHPPDRDLGAALADFHETLAGYRSRLPDVRDVVAEVDPLSEHVEDRATAAAFRRKLARLLPALDGIDIGRSRALHGDAHQANVVGVDGQLVWLDLEDACRGPIEYDLARARARVERWLANCSDYDARISSRFPNGSAV